MRTRLIAMVLTQAITARAQPAEPPQTGPATTEPVATEAPPPVLALDGEARNFERPPVGSYVHGSFVLRRIGRGIGIAVRLFLVPFRGVIQLEARWHLLSKLRILVNNENTLGLVPTVAFQSAFGLNVGARAFLDNYVGAGEYVAISANTGGSVVQAYQLDAELPHIGGAPIFLRTTVRYEENDNLFFSGIGNPGAETANAMLPATDTSTPTRFSQARFLTVLGAGFELHTGGTRVRIGGSGIYNARSFGPAGSSSTDPSIEAGYDTSTLRGFDDGFQNLELTADFEVDTRDHRGATTAGGVFRGFVGGASLVESARYGHYGVEAAYFVSPFWQRRTFVGRVALEGVVDSDNDTPFTELPRLGGAGLLRGYRTDRFRDKLATTATLEYRWPIHELITGELFVETAKVGRTYDALLGAGFADHWKFSYGGGLIIHTRERIRLRVDIAYGEGLELYLTTDVLDAFRKREREL
jgi:outer membrane protein assembly factor BamA